MGCQKWDVQLIDVFGDCQTYTARKNADQCDALILEYEFFCFAHSDIRFDLGIFHHQLDGPTEDRPLFVCRHLLAVLHLQSAQGYNPR